MTQSSHRLSRNNDEQAEWRGQSVPRQGLIDMHLCAFTAGMRHLVVAFPNLVRLQ